MCAQRSFPAHIDFMIELCAWGDFSGAWVRVWDRALSGELAVRSAKVYGNEGLRNCGVVQGEPLYAGTISWPRMAQGLCAYQICRIWS